MRGQELENRGRMPGKARRDKACFLGQGAEEPIHVPRVEGPWVESSLRGGSWVGLYFWLGYKDGLNSGKAHGSGS